MKEHYYVEKYGRVLSDFDDKFKAEEYARKVDGYVLTENLDK